MENIFIASWYETGDLDTEPETEEFKTFPAAVERAKRGAFKAGFVEWCCIEEAAFDAESSAYSQIVRRVVMSRWNRKWFVEYDEQV